MTTSVLDRNLNERSRLAALHEYAVLDSPADDELSAVVRIAAIVAGVPTATLNLIDENRQCQLTTVGFAGGNSPREESMCAIHFRTGEFVHVNDASLSPVYAQNPWVTGLLADVRFYASAPLITPEGYALGTLCVFDDKVKSLSPDQVSRLKDLADVIVALFERRRQARINAALAAQHERSKTFIETVLETIDVGVVVADATGRVTMLNRAAREWHGLAAEPDLPLAELPSQYDLYRADGRTRMAETDTPLLRALQGDEVTGAELVIRGTGGDPVAVSCNARALIADDGTPLGAVVAMNNVTKDRAQRRELEQAHADLAAAVTELRRSNEELESFAGAVSHDLVRPMAAAHGYLELLAADYGEAFDERAGKWMNAAVRAVERMENLVQALLTYARAGQAPMRLTPVELSEVVVEVLADLRTIAETSRAEITVADDLPTVLGDATLLRQLLQNLLDNAMKYRHPDRPCRVSVDASRTGDSWTVALVDNGIGIPPDQRNRVFEMFAQVDQPSRKGHGIGLSTCQRIVERHRGAIEVTETPGGGTTIRLHLPAHPAPF
ncbi:MAG: ATP-binding protein, partial [Actinoplanes sp.]